MQTTKRERKKEKKTRRKWVNKLVVSLYLLCKRFPIVFITTVFILSHFHNTHIQLASLLYIHIVLIVSRANVALQNSECTKWWKIDKKWTPNKHSSWMIQLILHSSSVKHTIQTSYFSVKSSLLTKKKPTHSFKTQKVFDIAWLNQSQLLVIFCSKSLNQWSKHWNSNSRHTSISNGMCCLVQKKNTLHFQSTVKLLFKALASIFFIECIEHV